MLYPSINHLLEKAGNRYFLVNEVAKRARRLVEGQEKLVETEEEKPVSIATLEVYEDKIFYRPLRSIERDVRQAQQEHSQEARPYQDAQGALQEND